MPKRMSWWKESAATKTFQKNGEELWKGKRKDDGEKKLVTVKDGRKRE